jgi:hypothetical protein
VNGELATIFNILQETDEPPTSQLIMASEEAMNAVSPLMNKWINFKKTQLLSLNEQLKSSGLPVLK